MFNYCSNLINLDISKFNTNKVDELGGIFLMKNIFKPYTHSTNLADNFIISNKNIKYTLIKRIGEGGFGICYMAKDENNKFYAIKKINIKNKEVVIKEINILEIMNNSKYSVNFLEFIEKDDNIYIVMELCDGDLYDLIKKKNYYLDILSIIKIIYQLNEVLKLMYLL